MAAMQNSTARKLNLGSGEFHKEGFINLDYRSHVGAEVVHDLNGADPLPFEDNYFDAVEADHVMEHLQRPFVVMRELHRVTKPGGTISIRVPHFSRGFSHPEHEHGFDVTFPLYFDPKFKGGYEGVEFDLEQMRLTWFAQRYLKKITVSPVLYYGALVIGSIIDVFANFSPIICSRLWCFWVGGFEEIHFLFKVRK